jgi:hypothetical protein
MQGDVDVFEFEFVGNQIREFRVCGLSTPPTMHADDKVADAGPRVEPPVDEPEFGRARLKRRETERGV